MANRTIAPSSPPLHRLKNAHGFKNIYRQWPRGITAVISIPNTYTMLSSVTLANLNRIAGLKGVDVPLGMLIIVLKN